jgi:hypothetical protein
VLVGVHHQSTDDLPSDGGLLIGSILQGMHRQTRLLCSIIPLIKACI